MVTKERTKVKMMTETKRVMTANLYDGFIPTHFHLFFN